MTCARCNGTRLIHELILPLGMPDPYTCPDCYVPPPPAPCCHACGQPLPPKSEEPSDGIRR